MKESYNHWIYITILLCGLLIYACISSCAVEQADYCDSDRRVLQDEEFIDATFVLLVLQRRDEFLIVGSPDKKKAKPYDEAYSTWSPDFKLDNCCVVRRENSWFNRLLRMQEVVVEIRPDTSTPSGEKYENVFDVCGQVKTLGLGYPLSVRKPIKTNDERLKIGRQDLRTDSNWSKRDF
jgi:hypothetical protein